MTMTSASSVVKPQASSTACSSVPAAAMLFTSSAAKPATTLTLTDVFTTLLEGNSSNADAQKLLPDIPVLQEWQRATRPSHKVRDAMLKLASNWSVTQKVQGKKRTPSEAAQDIEESMLKKGRHMLSGTKLGMEAYFKRSTSSRADEDPAALPLNETPASGTLQNLFRQLKQRQDEFPRGLVHDLLEAMIVLRTWQIVRQPTNAQRNAMAKIASKVWKVSRRVDGTFRSYDDIAADLEQILVSNAVEL